MTNSIFLRNASIPDIQSILAVLASNRDDISLFQQSEEEIRNNISDFILAEDENSNVIGCATLRTYDAHMGELCAVSVLPSCKGLGIGGSLVKKCISSATSKNIDFLWLATSKPSYFMRYGFRPMSRWSLPIHILMHKIGLVFTQPRERWLPAIFGRHTFMRLDR